MMNRPRRRARYRSVYINGIPWWECNRCGDRRLPAKANAQDLADHEANCGQPTN